VCLVIYPTKFEIHRFVIDPCIIATMNEEESKKLYEALLKNDTTYLTQMLKEGFDMSETVFDVPGGSDKSTSLEFAVRKNNVRLVQFLLEKCVNPNVGSVNGETPLIISIKAAFHQISEKLIVEGANTCKPDTDGKTPLYWAVETKNKKIINLLLDHGAELTVHTALLHAIDSDYLDIVKLLVERKAPINVVSPETPLTTAIMRGHSDIAKFLIKSGADLNLVGEHGTPLNIAIVEKNWDIVKTIIKSGADVNLVSKNGTPLNMVIQEENLDIMKFLIESGADVNLNDGHGTPLNIAIQKEFWDIAKFLIESSADVNLPDKTGNFPINVCMENLNFDILNRMIEKGLKVDQTLANTLLVWSLELEKVNLVKYFIGQGADVNQKKENDQTLLSIALKNSDLRSFRLLIESGADPRLAEAEIKEKIAKDRDFAVYVKSPDVESKMKELRIRGN
jgi:ankyrin repeat protein